MKYDDQEKLPHDVYLYRAVGVDEYASIIRTREFSVLETGLHVKYFGVDFSETLDFANKDFNIDVVAIFEVVINKSILDGIGDFTHVDPYIFKSGTVEIPADKLPVFNSSLLRITQKK